MREELGKLENYTLEVFNDKQIVSTKAQITGTVRSETNFRLRSVRKDYHYYEHTWFVNGAATPHNLC